MTKVIVTFRSFANAVNVSLAEVAGQPALERFLF
jgi:hypothetical protein